MNDVAEPTIEVDRETRPGPPVAAPPRRRLALRFLAAALVAGVAGAGWWWRHEVTAGPGFEFYGGGNVFRDEAATDRSGIVERPVRSGFGWDSGVEVAFQRNGRLFVFVGLLNGGRHDVRIEAAPPSGFWSWGFDRMSISADPDYPLVGVVDTYEPFRPFTLKAGDTRNVRLEFRLADCDPAGQPGGFSTLRSLEMRDRILGLTRTADVAFRNDAAVSLQAVGDCAEPIG